MSTTGLTGLRHQMVQRVLSGSRSIDPAVVEALRTVPRHAFLPGLAPEVVYQDDAIPTKRDQAGRPISSSSQPTIMALMLDQLDLAPGHRVLEIGAGTGYNAALLAHLVGPTGAVVSLDIDDDLVDRARDNLARAGYPQVTVVRTDGADGYPPGAPYDRIIATVGVWDLAPAWLEQLAPAGRLVVPLDLAGTQASVAFEPAGHGWTSRSVVPCGFMRMRGTQAGPERTEVLDRDTELSIMVPDGRGCDLTAAGLSEPARSRPIDVTVAPAALLRDLGLWLAVTEPRWCLLSESDTANPARLGSAPIAFKGSRVTAGMLDGTSLAVFADQDGRLCALGYGPHGSRLTDELAERVATWDRIGRPGTVGLHIEAHTMSTVDPERAGRTILHKRHTKLALSWTDG